MFLYVLFVLIFAVFVSCLISVLSSTGCFDENGEPAAVGDGLILTTIFSASVFSIVCICSVLGPLFEEKETVASACDDAEKDSIVSEIAKEKENVKGVNDYPYADVYVSYHDHVMLRHYESILVSFGKEIGYYTDDDTPSKCWDDAEKYPHIGVVLRALYAGINDSKCKPGSGGPSDSDKVGQGSDS